MEAEIDSSLSIWHYQLNTLTPGVFAGIFITLVLLFFSGLISGSESAYFLLTPDQRQKLAHLKSRKSQLVLRHLENPEKFLATILAANTFFNMGVIVSSVVTIGMIINFPNSVVPGFAFDVLVIAILILIFGEILPKVVSSRFPMEFASLTARPVNLLSFIFSPFSRLLISSTALINRRLDLHRRNISVDDLSHALELTSDAELSNEKNILEGIVRFGNKNVSEIMRPRVDVTAVDIKSSFSELLRIINETGYSRIPVCSGSFDQVHGILYIKDLLPHSHKGSSFKWQALIRPPFYVPESKKISTLLEEFQKRKVHLAIVVDEYGGSSGIVTLEDVLEEIVGEITDESDEIEPLYSKISENVFLFDARISLGEFCKITETDELAFDEVKGEAESLAGLILELRGEIPLLNETINFENFRFTIEAVNNRRIEKIKMEVLDQKA